MAKTKQEAKENLQQTLERLNKKYNQNKEESFFVSTGCLALDAALGGGIASGRITELIAWEGAGKTTLALHITAEAHKLGLTVSYVDAEHALSEKYARSIGVDWPKLKPLIFQPMFGEEAFDYANEVMKTGEIDVVIFDSTSGMIPKKQLEDDAGASHLGLHARLFSAEVPKINSIASMHNVLVIFISQVREKIGVLYGSPETTQCGNALRFFASNRIELRRSLNKEGTDVVNQTTRFKTLKCKTSSPFATGDMDIIFGKGIDQVLDLINVASELGFIEKAGSWYSYNGNKLGQGADSVRILLEDNEGLYEELRAKCIKAINEGHAMTVNQEVQQDGE